jgi:hypothetical protein
MEPLATGDIKMSLPFEAVIGEYQAATSDDIRLWSSGSVKRRLRPFENRHDWHDVAGTIWDERIFGPVSDWRCPCGRFDGSENARVVCPICGVRIAASVSRKIRMAHINLPVKIPHPFVADAERIDAIPIVPAYYWQTVAGEPLAKAYEEVVHQSLTTPSVEDLVGAYGVVIAHVEALFEHAPESDPDERERLARGLAMKLRPLIIEGMDENAEDDDEDDDWGELKLADDY